MPLFVILPRLFASKKLMLQTSHVPIKAEVDRFQAGESLDTFAEVLYAFICYFTAAICGSTNNN